MIEVQIIEDTIKDDFETALEAALNDNWVIAGAYQVYLNGGTPTYTILLQKSADTIL